MPYTPTPELARIEDSQQYSPPAELARLSNNQNASEQPSFGSRALDYAKKFGMAELNQAQNIGGGYVKGLQDMATMLPGVEKGPTDPYELFGTKDQPWNTIPGAEQTFGELLSPGKAGVEAVKYGGKLLSKAASPITNAFSKASPQKLGKMIQDSHDTLKSAAENMFEHVGEEAKKRGADIIPGVEKFGAEAAQYFPNTRNVKKLLEKVGTGSYDALRKLQADLFQRGTSAGKSVLQHERDAGAEMMDLRDRVNETISSHLKNTGNEDLSKILNEARSKYAELKKTYFGSKVPNAIKNMVHSESREIPKNIFNTLTRDSVPINRIKAANPDIELTLKDLIKKQNALTRLKYIGGAAATGVGAADLYHHGKNLFGS